MFKIIGVVGFSLLFWIAKLGYANEPMNEEQKTETLNAIHTIVTSDFYKPERLEAFRLYFDHKQRGLSTGRQFESMNAPFNYEIDSLLKTLNDAHTMRFDRSQSAYFELMDIFSYAVTDKDHARIFPGVAKPFYFGIGLVGEKQDGKYFISKLYDGLPAAKTGLLVGDELLSIERAASYQYPVFPSGLSSTRITVRRKADKAPLSFNVPIVKIQPQEMFLQASLASQKIIEKNGASYAYIRLWSGSNGNTFKELKKTLNDEKYSTVDGLVLDIRSRWGGANLEDANLFVSNIATMEMVLKDGTVIRPPTSWKKPVVALIDKGTRSGLEIFAYNLKKNKIPLVGETTAGALTAATAYLLPDDSLMMMGIGYTLLDGQNFDGIGITPDIEVKNHLPYSAGNDAQLNRALELLSQSGKG